MISKKNSIVIIVLIIVTRIMDGITTYIVTPDLKSELNPLIRVIGDNWLILSSVGGVFVALIIWYFYFSVKNQNRLNIKTNSFSKYAQLIVFNGKFNIQNILRLNINKVQVVFVGIWFSITLVNISIFLVLNNIYILSTYHSEYIYNIHLKIQYVHPFMVLISIVLIIIITFIYLLYKGYIYSKESVSNN